MLAAVWSATLSLVLQPASLPVAFAHGLSGTVVEMSGVRVECCQNKYCKKRGAAGTLKLLQELAEGRDDVQVVVADMSHTEHGCFDECMMGPNVRCTPHPVLPQLK